jgi:hypothetical protein
VSLSSGNAARVSSSRAVFEGGLTDGGGLLQIYLTQFPDELCWQLTSCSRVDSDELRRSCAKNVWERADESCRPDKMQVMCSSRHPDGRGSGGIGFQLRKVFARTPRAFGGCSVELRTTLLSAPVRLEFFYNERRVPSCEIRLVWMYISVLSLLKDMFQPEIVQILKQRAMEDFHFELTYNESEHQILVVDNGIEFLFRIELVNILPARTLAVLSCGGESHIFSFGSKENLHRVLVVSDAAELADGNFGISLRNMSSGDFNTWLNLFQNCGSNKLYSDTTQCISALERNSEILCAFAIINVEIEECTADDLWVRGSLHVPYESCVLVPAPKIGSHVLVFNPTDPGEIIPGRIVSESQAHGLIDVIVSRIGLAPVVWYGIPITLVRVRIESATAIGVCALMEQDDQLTKCKVIDAYRDGKLLIESMCKGTSQRVTHRVDPNETRLFGLAMVEALTTDHETELSRCSKRCSDLPPRAGSLGSTSVNTTPDPQSACNTGSTDTGESHVHEDPSSGKGGDAEPSAAAPDVYVSVEHCEDSCTGGENTGDDDLEAAQGTAQDRPIRVNVDFNRVDSQAFASPLFLTGSRFRTAVVSSIEDTLNFFRFTDDRNSVTVGRQDDLTVSRSSEIIVQSVLRTVAQAKAGRHLI